MFSSYVLAKKALRQIHNHSFKNQEEISKSLICYCFHCKRASASSQITKWVDDGETATCPRCGIDSMIGDASGYEMTGPLMEEMHTFWFEMKFVGDDFDWDLLEPLPD